MARKIDFDTFKEYLASVKDLVPQTIRSFSEDRDKSRTARVNVVNDVYERIKAEQELCIEKLKNPDTPKDEQNKYFERLKELGKEFVENRNCLMNAEKESDNQAASIMAIALVVAAIPLGERAGNFVAKNLPKMLAENLPKLLNKG